MNFIERWFRDVWGTKPHLRNRVNVNPPPTYPRPMAPLMPPPILSTMQPPRMPPPRHHSAAAIAIQGLEQSVESLRNADPCDKKAKYVALQAVEFWTQKMKEVLNDHR